MQVKFGVWILEEGTQRCDDARTLGGAAVQMAVLYDRRGMTMKNTDSKLFKVAVSLVDIAQDYYAERLGRVYVVGANW